MTPKMVPVPAPAPSISKLFVLPKSQPNNGSSSGTYTTSSIYSTYSLTPVGSMEKQLQLRSDATTAGQPNYDTKVTNVVSSNGKEYAVFVSNKTHNLELIPVSQEHAKNSSLTQIGGPIVINQDVIVREDNHR